MTTKDIIENMKKEFDELTFKYEGIDEPLSLDSKEEAIIKSFIHSYTLTLLESFGEEIQPSKFEIKGKDDEYCSAFNDGHKYAVKEVGLKVKEILLNLK